MGQTDTNTNWPEDPSGHDSHTTGVKPSIDPRMLMRDNAANEDQSAGGHASGGTC